MNYFSKDSVAEKARNDRSLMTAGLELHYDVSLDAVIGAGGQGDVYKAERKFDKLQVAIKVTPRSRLRPGPGVCSHLVTFKTKASLNSYSVLLVSTARAGNTLTIARCQRCGKVDRSSVRWSW